MEPASQKLTSQVLAAGRSETEVAAGLVGLVKAHREALGEDGGV